MVPGAALLAQIRADREETAHYLAYADLLQAAGDPRGELIVLQHQLATRPHDRALRRAEHELLRRHAATLLPPTLLAAGGNYRKLDVRWRLGFLHRVRLAHEHWRDPTVTVVLKDLLAHPSSWVLHSLTIGPACHDQRGQYAAL